MVLVMFRDISKRKTDRSNARFFPVVNYIPSVLSSNANLTRGTEWNTRISFLAVGEACYFMAAGLTISQLGLTNVCQAVMS
jgi:hypothetical protein